MTASEIVPTYIGYRACLVTLNYRSVSSVAGSHPTPIISGLPSRAPSGSR
jgi:hypothetical protein